MKYIQIMGILNLTPDSFSDGGIYYKNTKKAVQRVKDMLDEGADIIDIGGESTRPGAGEISIDEELDRVIPVIKAVRSKLGTTFPISVDTYKSAVAQEALKKGATIINSLGGMQFDPELVKVVKEFQCKLIIYHIKGTPRTMQTGEITYTDVVKEITQFFEEQIELGEKNGVQREQFILDPGIGFGKTVEQNLEIIKRLREFSRLGLPILIGVSRKSHLGTLLKEKLSLQETPAPEQRLEASLAETAIAVLNGARIVRTHDVSATKKFLTVLEELI